MDVRLAVSPYSTSCSVVRKRRSERLERLRRRELTWSPRPADTPDSAYVFLQ